MRNHNTTASAPAALARTLARARGSRAMRAIGAATLALGVLGLAGCGQPVPQDETVIAGGAPAGIYSAYSTALADVLDSEGMNAEAAATGGSIDNLLRVGRGEATFGFAQADAAADAVSGVGAFDTPLPVSGVARVYDEYVQVVVPDASPADDISDLRGLRVSVGEPNSGVRVIAERVLEAAGVTNDSFTRETLGIDDSIAALADGQIDAFFWVGGIPTPGIKRLAEETPVRVLSIHPGVVERVNSGHAGVYRLSDLPPSLYGGVAPVETMTVPNYLVVASSAPDELVFEVTRALFDSRTELSTQVPVAALLDRRQAIFTSPLRLHPGAAEYYVSSRY